MLNYDIFFLKKKKQHSGMNHEKTCRGHLSSLSLSLENALESSESFEECLLPSDEVDPASRPSR